MAAPLFRVVLLSGLAWGAGGAAETHPPSHPASMDFSALRAQHLQDIFLLRDYRPGKNSFVEGPDRRLGRYTAPGERFTLLDVNGAGSVRHLWSTWAPGKGNHRLEFFADGAKQATLAGTPDELITEIRRTDPGAAFIGERGARNLYLPVEFQRAMRIELETVEPTWLIFYQVDYRLGASERPAASPYSAPAATRTSAQAVLPIGGTAPVATVTGPAIVRRWSIQTNMPLGSQNELELAVSYDGGKTAAVRAPLGDFFGPFRGVSFATDPKTGMRTCWLPMPIRHGATFSLTNHSTQPVRVEFEAELEPATAWDPRWGWFHALGQTTARTTGYRQHQVVYVRGRGHWLGMSLYGTGHDHGGGDFAVLDGEGPAPAFLHGINGEDYFTFAWFGRGAHHPYAVAHTNEAGRYRHHFENPYPFRQSLSIYWGTYPDLSTRSVAYWYQDTPEDTTLADAANPLNVDWDCFGPVPLPLDASHRPVGDAAAVLPRVAELDAGRQFECRCVTEKFTTGWMTQRSIGPMLDLTYLSRHGTKIRGEVELGGMGHAWLARRKISSPTAQRVSYQISHDDPLRVLINGQEVFAGGGHAGFATSRFTAPLRAGENEITVQLTSFFNVNFNWAGFALREVK